MEVLQAVRIAKLAATNNNRNVQRCNMTTDVGQRLNRRRVQCRLCLCKLNSLLENVCLRCRPRRTSFDASNRATRSSPETSTVPKCCRNCGTRLSACSRRLRICGDVTAARFPSDSFPQAAPTDGRCLFTPTRRTACPFPLPRTPSFPLTESAAQARASLCSGGASAEPHASGACCTARRRRPSPGADVAESRRRCRSVPAQMWPSPGADVAQSQRSCG
jgi:hypothetical protein